MTMTMTTTTTIIHGVRCLEQPLARHDPRVVHQDAHNSNLGMMTMGMVMFMAVMVMMRMMMVRIMVVMRVMVNMVFVHQFQTDDDDNVDGYDGMSTIMMYTQNPSLEMMTMVNTIIMMMMAMIF